jgi:hypothetical protein
MTRFGVPAVAFAVAVAWLPGAAPAQTFSTGYIQVTRTGNTITSLKFDATGAGNYGMETVTGAGIRSVSAVALQPTQLTLTVGSTPQWDLPFVRAGYYDPDLHLNYPNDTNTAGATPLTLPFLCFVGSSGNTTRIEHFKRLPLGTYWLNLNIQDGSRLLMPVGTVAR